MDRQIVPADGYAVALQPEKSGKRYLDLLPDDKEPDTEAISGSGERPASAGQSGLDSSFGGMLQGLMYARAAAQDARSLGTSSHLICPTLVPCKGARHDMLRKTEGMKVSKEAVAAPENSIVAWSCHVDLLCS